MKLFQTSQHETINISMIANIKPIHSREIGEDAEILYTRDEYSRLIHAKDVNKCRVVNQEVRWSQAEYPVVAYKVITTNGSVVISVPDYERLMKSLSSWLTDDAGEDAGEDDAAADDNEHYDDESTEPAVKLTQDIFKYPYCPKWAKWAAVDADGTICVYQKKPDIEGGYFAVSDGDVVDRYNGVEQVDNIPGWQKTLIKREE